MSERIVKFNHIVGNPPVGIDGDVDAFWNQLELQAKLVLEEAKEFYKAACEKDLIECIDGNRDVWYLNKYADKLLEEVGVDVQYAGELVCDNNDQKYTRIYSKALDGVDFQKEQGVEAYVESVEYNGDIFYVIKRKSDNKVLKFRDHQAPKLSKAIELTTLTKFGVEDY